MYTEAALIIKTAKILIITAGAGIGVDSGLPDFRGPQGFWNAYKAFKNKFSFQDCANPAFLRANPVLFWGFYGHRLNLYRKTEPHQGFQILKKFAGKMKSYFIITSNVDGQFQKAGFSPERIHEIHGSIHHFQCNSCEQIFQAEKFPEITVDEETFQAKEPLPICPNKECKPQPIRPNILMFYDGEWLPFRSDQQEENYNKFLKELKGSEDKIVIIEIGAGLAIPSIRCISELLIENKQFSARTTLIRINLHDSQTHMPTKGNFIGIAEKALKALQEIDKEYDNLQII